MSELSLNTALPPELLNSASGHASGPIPAPGSPDWASPDTGPGSGANAAGRSPVNPFAALLSGILQGAQPAVVDAEFRVSDTVLPDPESARLLSLPGATGPPSTVGDGIPVTEEAYAAGNALPATGKNLPPERGAGPPPAPTNSPAPGPDTPAPMATRPGISLADLAWSRQPDQAPVLYDATASASRLDATRSAPAMTLAARTLSASRTQATELPAATLRQPPELAVNLAVNAADGREASAAAISTDSLALRQGAADFLRGALASGTGLPGAGAEFAGRQLAAFATGGDSRIAMTGSASPAGGAGTDHSSANLLSRLGSTTLPGLQPLGDSGAFAGGLADRLLMLGGPGAHSARLRLYPEHLGELQVDIRIDDGSAEVWFATTTPQAREAIEGSLPRLRELFADQGLQLTRAQVDTGAGQMGNPGSDPQRQTAGGSGPPGEPAWRPATGSAALARAALPAETGATARLLDVWA